MAMGETMNSRRPKIWQTEDQIIAAIDRTKRMAERLLKKSHKLDEQCKQTYGHLEELRFEAMKRMRDSSLRSE